MLKIHLLKIHPKKKNETQKLLLWISSGRISLQRLALEKWIP